MTGSFSGRVNSPSTSTSRSPARARAGMAARDRTGWRARAHRSRRSRDDRGDERRARTLPDSARRPPTTVAPRGASARAACDVCSEGVPSEAGAALDRARRSWERRGRWRGCKCRPSSRRRVRTRRGTTAPALYATSDDSRCRSAIVGRGEHDGGEIRGRLPIRLDGASKRARDEREPGDGGDHREGEAKRVVVDRCGACVARATRESRAPRRGAARRARAVRRAAAARARAVSRDAAESPCAS